MWIKWKTRIEFKIFLRGPEMEKYFLDLPRALKNREYTLEVGWEMYLDYECAEFVIAGWSKVEIYDWSWSKHFCIELYRIPFFSNLFVKKIFACSEDYEVWYRTK